MSLDSLYIICECGEDFKNEEELSEHLKDNHEKKEPSDWEEDFSEEEPDEQMENEVITQDPKEQTTRTSSDSSSNEDTKLLDILESGNVITLKFGAGQKISSNFHEVFANEMVLSHEEVIEQNDLSPVTVLKTPIKEEQDQNDYFVTEEIFTDPSFVLEAQMDHPLVCELCERVFTSKRSLALHYAKTHNRFAGPKRKRRPTAGIKDRICEVCGKGFSSKASLKYHQNIHTGERPYVCSYCHKGFTMPLLLQIHVRIHTGEKPYQCQLCPKAFGSKSAINRHQKVHTGAKPYACGECGKAFSQSNSMKLHVRTVHRRLPAPYKSKKRLQAELEQIQNRDKRYHTAIRVMKKSTSFKNRNSYLNVVSTLT